STTYVSYCSMNDFFFFQAEDGIRDGHVTGVQTCALPILSYPFRGVRDGDVLELGNVSIQVLHTPGHTPEHISLLVTDQTRSDERSEERRVGKECTSGGSAEQ